MSKQTPTAKETGATDKTPNTAIVPESVYPKNPSWRFARADVEHLKWSVLDSHENIVEDPSDSTGTRYLHKFSRSIDSVLLEGLKARESTTWGAILTQNGGRRGGTNSHHIPIKEMIKEAQQRAAELNLDVDELLSVRLTGKQRVYGILEDSVFNVIWFDREHKICESTKS